MRKFLLAIIAIAFTVFQSASASQAESELEGFGFGYGGHYKKRVCSYKHVSKCNSFCFKKYRSSSCGCNYFSGYSPRCGCFSHGICKW